MNWQVIVLSKPGGRELAKYCYGTRREAQEVRRNVQQVRSGNGESDSSTEAAETETESTDEAETEESDTGESETGDDPSECHGGEPLDLDWGTLEPAIRDDEFWVYETTHSLACVVISGACSGRIPSMPAPPGATTMSTSFSRNTTRSAVTISMFSLSAMLAPHFFGDA